MELVHDWVRRKLEKYPEIGYKRYWLTDNDTDVSALLSLLQDCKKTIRIYSLFVNKLEENYLFKKVNPPNSTLLW